MSTLSLTLRSEADGVVVISPQGEIDADSVHEIKDAFSGLLATGQPSAVEFDLTAVTFIDSVGISALVSCYHAAAASGVGMRVTNPTEYVHRVLYVSGLLGLFGAPARPQPRHRPMTDFTAPAMHRLSVM